MPATVFRSAEWIVAASPAVAVAAPVGEPVSTVRTTVENSTSAPGSRFGVWECTPGTWRRQVRKAEFCHFLSGDATFQPDDGPAVRLAEGDSAYFPEASEGIWIIRETSRKVFVTFDETVEPGS